MANLKLIASNDIIPDDKREIFYWLYMSSEMEKMLFRDHIVKNVKFVDAVKYCKSRKWHRMAYEIKALRKNFDNKKFDELKIKFQDMINGGSENV